MIRSLIFLISFFFIASIGRTQNTDQELLWLRYYNTIKFSEKFSLHTEIEERRFLNPQRQHQRLLPRIGAQYRFNETVYGNVGFTYFQAYNPQDPTLPEELNVELRPHQYIEFDHYHKRLRFKQRFMTEQRFIGTSQNDYRFSFRLRLLNAVLIDFLKDFNSYEESRLSLHLQNETMLQTGEGISNEYFDQTRFYLGIDSRWSEMWRIDAGAMLWLQQVPASSIYYRRLIGRITVHHYFQLNDA